MSQTIRDKLFADIRQALGGRPMPDARVVRQQAAALLDQAGSTQPAFTEDSVSRFVAKLTSAQLTGTIDHVGDLGDVPRALKRYLDEKALGPAVSMVAREDLKGLDWGAITPHHSCAPDEPISVGFAEAGIAETGSLVFYSAPETPTLFNFFPLHHVVVLKAQTIVRHMEDFWRAYRQANHPAPRNINLVTGTSGTADIEAKNIRGAHGPRFLHVILLNDAAA